MASIVLTVADENVPRVLAGIETTGFEQQDGENAADFVKRYLAHWFRHLDRKARAKAAAAAIGEEEIVT